MFPNWTELMLFVLSETAGACFSTFTGFPHCGNAAYIKEYGVK